MKKDESGDITRDLKTIKKKSGDVTRELKAVTQKDEEETAGHDEKVERKESGPVVVASESSVDQNSAVSESAKTQTSFSHETLGKAALVESAQPFRFPPFLRGGRAATIFLTRFTVGGFPFSRADWHWSTAWFPFVGLLLGGLQAGIAWGLLKGFDPWITAWIVVGISMLMTGAFHEDGLADTADALGGTYDRKRLFVILKDSRIGSFGSAALIVALGLRVTLLAKLGKAMPLGLLLSQCLGRLPPIWSMRLMHYVSEDSGAKSKNVARAGWSQVLMATSWPATLLAVLVAGQWLTPSRMIGILVAMLCFFVLCLWRFQKRAGGLTGDFLGAMEQVMELVILGGLAWSMG